MDHVFLRLNRALAEAHVGAVVFDADGTLWSGDVGEDMFTYGVAHGLLRQAAQPRLSELARTFGVETTTESNLQARLLFDAYRLGVLPERHACEMMAWAFAGFSRATLAELAGQVLSLVGLRERRFRPIEQVIAWARERELPTFVVSASPSFVIEAATAELGFSPEHIAACEPDSDGDLLLARLRLPLPYAEQKVHAAARLSGGLPLLAAFGDNTFDLAMLEAARVSVAVRPKPALSELLLGRDDILVVRD